MLLLDGPDRWIRYPFYGSAALLSVAISLIAANWFLFVTGVVLFCLLIIRTRTEEENLVARFGDSYERTWNGPGASCLELERSGVAPNIALEPAAPVSRERRRWSRRRGYHLVKDLTNTRAATHRAR